METVPLADLPEFAHTLLARLPEKKSGATLLTLSGNLGAGKTTFVQALARELGVKDIVQSPTYVLMKLYDISYKHFTKLVHIDLYRLEKPEELAALKLEKIFAERGALVALEWPERAEGKLPIPDMVLQFSSDGASAEERYIEATHV